MLTLHHTPEEFRISDFVITKSVGSISICLIKRTTDQENPKTVFWITPKSEIPNPKFSLSFNTDHLFDLCDNCDQVFLVLHYRFDRFVSAGNFIQYAVVLATLNACRLLHQISACEVTLCGAARHLAAGTVRA